MTIGKYTIEFYLLYIDKASIHSEIENFLYEKLKSDGLSENTFLVIRNNFVEVKSIKMYDYNNTIMIYYSTQNAD